MTFEVRCGNIVLGHSELENVHNDGGMRSGPFRPAAGYEQFRPLFRRLARAVGTSRDPDKAAKAAEDLEELSSLGLRLFDPTGQEVPAIIDVHDYSVEVGPHAYQLEVHLVGAR